MMSININNTIPARSRDMYGYIYEPGTGTNVTITSIGARTQELFTSTTNVVQIVLLAPTTLNPREFLVQYESKWATGPMGLHLGKLLG